MTRALAYLAMTLLSLAATYLAITPLVQSVADSITNSAALIEASGSRR